MHRLLTLALACVAAAAGAGAELSLAAEPGPPIAPDEAPALYAAHAPPEGEVIAVGGWTANDAYENRASWADYAYQSVDNPPAPAPSSPASSWPTVLIAAWAVLTFVVNGLFHAFTPKDVDAWAERNPWLARLAAIFRRAGIEPVALLIAVKDFFSSNPPPPAVVGGNTAMGKKNPYRGGDPISAAGRRGAVDVVVAFWLGVTGVAVAAFAVVACGVFRGADAPGDAKDLAQCEARVAEENPEAAFADFVKASLASCLTQGIRTVADVVAWIVGTSDPHAARYKPAAREAQADSAKMGALRAQVGHP